METVGSSARPEHDGVRAQRWVGVGHVQCAVLRPHVYPVQWSRPTQYDPFEFRTAEGVEIPVGLGVTFVEVVDDT